MKCKDSYTKLSEWEKQIIWCEFCPDFDKRNHATYRLRSEIDDKSLGTDGICDECLERYRGDELQECSDCGKKLNWLQRMHPEDCWCKDHIDEGPPKRNSDEIIEDYTSQFTDVITDLEKENKQLRKGDEIHLEAIGKAQELGREQGKIEAKKEFEELQLKQNQDTLQPKTSIFSDLVKTEEIKKEEKGKQEEFFMPSMPPFNFTKFQSSEDFQQFMVSFAQWNAQCVQTMMQETFEKNAKVLEQNSKEYQKRIDMLQSEIDDLKSKFDSQQTSLDKSSSNSSSLPSVSSGEVLPTPVLSKINEDSQSSDIQSILESTIKNFVSNTSPKKRRKKTKQGSYESKVSNIKVEQIFHLTIVRGDSDTFDASVNLGGYYTGHHVPYNIYHSTKEPLKGDLDLTQFRNLRKLTIDGHDLKTVDLTCNSHLAILNITNCNLRKIIFPPSESIWRNNVREIDLSNNNIRPSDIKVFNNLWHLNTLKLGTNDPKIISDNKYNRWYGSLKNLEFSKLETLDISSTDINEGLEHLPTQTLKNFTFGDYDRYQADVGKIKRQITKYIVHFKENGQEEKIKIKPSDPSRENYMENLARGDYDIDNSSDSIIEQIKVIQSEIKNSKQGSIEKQLENLALSTTNDEQKDIIAEMLQDVKDKKFSY